MCGGNWACCDSRQLIYGLSPRVRGKLLDTLWLTPMWGSIPACAGETWHDRNLNAARKVYPRVCGGNPQSAQVLLDGKGLSPRVRGKRQPNPAGPGR